MTTLTVDGDRDIGSVVEIEAARNTDWLPSPVCCVTMRPGTDSTPRRSGTQAEQATRRGTPWLALSAIPTSLPRGSIDSTEPKEVVGAGSGRGAGVGAAATVGAALRAAFALVLGFGLAFAGGTVTTRPGIC